MMLKFLALLWTSIVPAVKNHLWQSTLLLLLAALLSLVLKKNHARSRYWLWLAASVKFLVPFSLLVALGSHLSVRQSAPRAQASAYVAVDEFSEPFVPEATAAVDVPMAVPTVAGRDAAQIVPRVLAAVWFAGFACVLCVWGVSWRRVSAAVRNAVPMDEGREVELLRRLERLGGVRAQIRLMVSDASMEPGVFGIVRPVLIWPKGMSERLNDAHVEAILAHEVMHVRRCDNLTALLHMFVEAAFWFHPLVWWLGARLVDERERACDEEVLHLCRRPEVYAEGILKVCEFCLESPLPCVSGVTGSDLKKRISNLLAGHVTLRLGRGKKLLLVAVAVGAAAVPVVMGQAQAARRMMLAVAHAMIAEVQTPSTGELQAPGAGVDAPANADATGPAFATVTIRPSGTDAQGRRFYGLQFPSSGRMVLSSMPLRLLIMYAYSDDPQRELQVEGGAKWTETDQFDINAQVDKAELPDWDKLPVGLRVERARPLLQTLLEQRFKLKGHTATISTPVYVLEQTKGGSKLKGVPAPTSAELKAAEEPEPNNQPTDTPRPGIAVSNTGWVGHAAKIQELMGWLGYTLDAQDKPMLDRTGLTGYYDLSLSLIKQESGPTREQQMEEQLGLRLEARNVPMKTFVIDSVAKPTLDAAGAAAAMAVAEPAPPPLPHIHFDVVSWKRCNPDAKGNARVDMPLDSDFVAYHCQPIHRIIYFAFTGPGAFELSGDPSWVDDDPYEFQAKVAPDDIAAWKAMTIDERRVAVRDILADQLKLQIRVDKTPQPAYALVVAKGGPKLPEYKVGEQWKIPDGRILEGRTHVFNGNVGYFQNSDMNNLASNLSARLDRPVVNQTGLAGSYDVTLPISKAAGVNPFADTGDEPNVESGLEDLGLKLVPAKIEADGFVVDHIERPPVN